MVTLKDMQAHLEQRSPVPRLVYGLALVVLLGIVIFFGYYVWNGVQESNRIQEIPTRTRMSDEDAAKLRAQVMEGTTGTMQVEGREKIADELIGDSEMSETDAARLRAQLTQ